MELEQEQVWTARTESEQELTARMQWEWAAQMAQAQVGAVQMESEQELTARMAQAQVWAARTQATETLCPAAPAIPCFPAGSPLQTAQAAHTTPGERCGASGECPAATAPASLASPADPTPQTGEASRESRGTQGGGAKAQAAREAGHWGTAEEAQREKRPPPETFRANPQRS